MPVWSLSDSHQAPAEHPGWNSLFSHIFYFFSEPESLVQPPSHFIIQMTIYNHIVYIIYIVLYCMYVYIYLLYRKNVKLALSQQCTWVTHLETEMNSGNVWRDLLLPFEKPMVQTIPACIEGAKKQSQSPKMHNPRVSTAARATAPQSPSREKAWESVRKYEKANRAPIKSIKGIKRSYRIP